MNYARSVRRGCVPVILAILSLIWGCAAQDLGAQSGVPQGGEPIDGPQCGQGAGQTTQCIADQAEACDALLNQGGCTDEDGDCFPTKCSDPELNARFAERADASRRVRRRG